MKKFAKILALALALTLVLSLAACGKKEATIVGKWSTTMEMEKLLESEDAQEMGEMMEMFGSMFKGVSLKINLEFKEDGTYEMAADQDSVKSAAQAMVENLKVSLPSLLSGLYGVEEDKLDEALAEQGSSMDEIMAEMESSMDLDSMVEELGDDANEKGTYRFEEGKLYMTKDGDTEDTSEYWTVELSGSELKVTDIVGTDEDSEAFKAMLPLIFTK